MGRIIVRSPPLVSPASVIAGAGGAPAPPFPFEEWVDLTPDQIDSSSLDTLLGMGVAVCLDDPTKVIWCNGPLTVTANSGVYRSDSYGLPDTYTKIGNVSGGFIENPMHAWFDPDDSDRVLICSGVRGSNQGLFESTNGGVDCAQMAGFTSALSAAGVTSHDLYTFSVNPLNKNHILCAWHSPWGGAYGGNSGIAEYLNGTWTIHPPESTWGTGHAIEFITTEIWILGTQSDGRWRTDDSGATWTQVSSQNIAHGGGQLYYNSTQDTWYAPGEDTIQRSDDEGITWEDVASSEPTWAIGGDGINMYFHHNGATEPLQYSPVNDGETWANYDSTDFEGGAFRFADVPTIGVLFVSYWYAGLWAIKTRNP